MAHDPADDLLRQWREQKTPAALGELLKAHRERAYAVAFRLTGSSADAEDAVQDALLKMMTRTHGMEDMDAFRCSLYRATVQCALDVVRKVRRRGGGSAVETQAAPIENAELAETRALVNASVARLEENERLPVTLCFYEGMSVVQAAATLEVPRETLRARLARALEKLRHDLRLHGKEMGSASLLALMWNDPVAAPASLNRALDAALPGKPCAEVVKSARLKAFEMKTLSATWILPAKVAAALLLSLAAVQLARRADTGGATPNVVEKVTSNEGVDPKVYSPNKGEENAMKGKMSAVVLVGASLLSSGVMAADPKPDVAAALQQIEARKAEKAAVAARQMKQWAQRERREIGEDSGERPVTVKPGGSVYAPGASAPQGNPAK